MRQCPAVNRGIAPLHAPAPARLSETNLCSSRLIVKFGRQSPRSGASPFTRIPPRCRKKARAAPAAADDDDDDEEEEEEEEDRGPSAALLPCALLLRDRGPFNFPEGGTCRKKN